MLTKNYFTLALATLVIVTLFSGCTMRTKPPRFYTLSPVVDEYKSLQVNNSNTSSLIIGIGPIKIADYLAQSRIVTRIDDNAINLAEFDQWSGSLQNNIANVLSENISSILGTSKVVIHPWRSFIPIDCQVLLEIVRFDGDPDDKVTLVASWVILRDRDKSIVDMNRITIHENIGVPDYGGLVAAQSKALGQLGVEISQSIIQHSMKEY
ncbi:membrane integrity-associated transporter subunit PqiC [Desulfopila sp. IMCC35008]|uniref:PqiC family protein n=1 Tax=Desulfopila sp. IMCC35008 TaxID=2653858 RepID=UPI0013D0AC79|nr:PqiC family protein [Desulfopila sp. IMCC35008]